MALKCFRRLVLVGCLSEVLRLMASRWDCEVTLDEGVPGCGKTNFIKQKANLEQTLILTPGRINYGWAKGLLSEQCSCWDVSNASE